MDVDGDTIAVGATSLSTYAVPKANRGAVFMYRLSGGSWALEQKLVARDPMPYDAFGMTVSLDGSRLVVGVPYDDYGQELNAGSVAVFERIGTTWMLAHELVSSGTGDVFGLGLDLDGDRLVVGGFVGIVRGVSPVAMAEVFDLSYSPVRSTALMGPYEGVITACCRDVAVEGDRILVGAYASVRVGYVYDGVEVGMPSLPTFVVSTASRDNYLLGPPGGEVDLDGGIPFVSAQQASGSSDPYNRDRVAVFEDLGLPNP